MKRLLAAAVVVLAAALFLYAFVGAPERPTESADAAESIEDGRMDDMADALAERFPGAAEDVTGIARRIMAGETPGSAELAALPAGALDQSFSQPFPDRAPDYRHTLLREAVVSRNIGAARELVAAGADARLNEDEMAYLAVRMETRDGQSVWWPDFALGTEFLRLWLEAGGDPNATNRIHGGSGNLLVSTEPTNLEGILTLLEAGTDPWARPVAAGDTSDEPFRYPSFFLRKTDSALTTSELTFQIARAGLYRGGTAEDRQELLAEYDNTARNNLNASGPDGLAHVWGMQMALREILPALELEPTDAIAQLLAIEIPDDVGGFWLAPGEIRSPPGDAHALRSDNQRGAERWDDR